MKTTRMSLVNIQGKLSRMEMKNIIAGILPKVDTIYCKDGSSLAHPDGDCSCGSAGQCNGHGGVNNCLAYGHVS